MIDESEADTAGKAATKNSELTVTGENVSVTNETVIQEDLDVIYENLRKTKSDQTMAVANLSTLGGCLTSLDRNFGVAERKAGIQNEPDYQNTCTHHYKPLRTSSSSSQRIYEEAIVDSYESQSSGIYQGLDTSTVDYLSLYSIPAGEGRGREKISLEGNVSQTDDVAGQLCASIKQDNTDSHIYISLD